MTPNAETVEFVDQTLRDGHQSLWGMRMRPREILPVADLIDRAGFRVVDLVGWTHQIVRIREFGEDPWESLDLLVKAMPHSVLRSCSPTSSIGVLNFTPRALLELSIRCHVRRGIRSYWILDCLLNLDKMRHLCRIVRDAGARATPAVMYSLSPVHTDDYFVRAAREMATWDSIDSVYLEDASGVLTPDRARTLLPKLVAALGEVPLELHFHNNNGLAPLCYIEGIRSGARILHTAARSLANGPSLPATETMVDNAKRLGYRVDLDESVLPEISEHFAWIAAHEGYPIGVPHDYSVFNYEHQLPGGMTATLRNQLRKHGVENRLDETLEEIVNVRRELGYPVMASPFSQFVGIQSVLNVTLGKRYEIVPDEVIMYLLGLYGEIPGVPDPGVLDRILSTPRARELRNWQPPEPTLTDIRNQFGRSLSDEELLLRWLVDEDALEKMRRAGPIDVGDPARVRDLAKLVRVLAATTDWDSVHLEHDGLTMTLSRRPAGENVT